MRYRIKNARLITAVLSIWAVQKELRELIHRHQADGDAAAKDIMAHPQQYPTMSSYIIPQKFFEDKLQTKGPRELLENLTAELAFYAPLAPGGLPTPPPIPGTQTQVGKESGLLEDMPERSETMLQFQNKMQPSRELPVEITPQENENILEYLSKVQESQSNQADSAKILWQAVNQLILKKYYLKYWNKLGAGGPLTKGPSQFGWKTAYMARHVVNAFIKG